jgi:hypothetical protein
VPPPTICGRAFPGGWLGQKTGGDQRHPSGWNRGGVPGGASLQSAAIGLCQMEFTAPGGSDGRIGGCRPQQARECPPPAKKHPVKPGPVKSWIIPEAGPDVGCALEEVLDVYAQPYDPAYPRVCLDESPRQLIGERRAPRMPRGLNRGMMNTRGRGRRPSIWSGNR